MFVVFKQWTAYEMRISDFSSDVCSSDLVIVVPDMLFIAALLFLLASSTRSLLATYIGGIVYFVLQGIVGQLTKDVNNHFIAAMLDPFGGRTVGLATRYWSAYQSNHELPALTGVLLFNRLLWIGEIGRAHV